MTEFNDSLKAFKAWVRMKDNQYNTKTKRKNKSLNDYQKEEVETKSANPKGLLDGTPPEEGAKWWIWNIN